MTNRAFIQNVMNVKSDKLTTLLERVYESHVNGNKSKELEVRFGKYVKKGKFGKFVPGVSKSTFQKILKAFQGRYSVDKTYHFDLSYENNDRLSHTSQKDETFDDFYKNKLSKIKGKGFKGSNKITMVRKSKGVTQDVRHSEIHEYDMRIQVSSENEYESFTVPKKDPSFIRHKSRTTFFITKSGDDRVRLDMTIIKEGNMNTIDKATPKYEIELENIHYTIPVPNRYAGDEEWEMYEENKRTFNPVIDLSESVQTVWGLLPIKEKM